MAIDVAKYAQELAQDAGLTAEQSEAFLKVMSNEKVSKKLGDELMTRPDYSRAQDELKKQQTEFAQQQTAWQDWYKRADAAVQAQQGELVKTRASLNAYEQTYGSLDGTTTGTTDTTKAPTNGEYISTADAQKAFQQLEQATVNVMEDLTVIQGDHWRSFGAPLGRDEVTAIKDIALRDKIRLTDAYSRFASPKLAEKSTSEWEAKVKVAREEGAKDALTKHNIPMDGPSKAPAPFLENLRKNQAGEVKKGTPDTVRQAFVEAYNTPTRP